jgi:hypothetical protein
MGLDLEHSCSHVAEWEEMFNKTVNVIRDEFIVSGLNQMHIHAMEESWFTCNQKCLKVLPSAGEVMLTV